jgi:hypothetical protein
MQKAHFEMNVQLSKVISDITGESGLRMIEAILAGERDPEQLASLCSIRIKATRQTVAKSLRGNWDAALLFCLKMALGTYRFSQNKIQACDNCIEPQLAAFEIRRALPNATRNLRTQLHQVCGIDLTKIQALKSNRPRSLSRRLAWTWADGIPKTVSSFLGLCPDNSITGGKILRRATRKVYNRAADTLRLCAQSLSHSKSALSRS